MDVERRPAVGLSDTLVPPRLLLVMMMTQWTAPILTTFSAYSSQLVDNGYYGEEEYCYLGRAPIINDRHSSPHSPPTHSRLIV